MRIENYTISDLVDYANRILLGEEGISFKLYDHSGSITYPYIVKYERLEGILIIGDSSAMLIPKELCYIFIQPKTRDEHVLRLKEPIGNILRAYILGMSSEMFNWDAAETHFEYELACGYSIRIFKSIVKADEMFNSMRTRDTEGYSAKFEMNQVVVYSGVEKIVKEIYDKHSVFLANMKKNRDMDWEKMTPGEVAILETAITSLAGVLSDLYQKVLHGEN